MEINKELFDRVAGLAKLSFSEEEAEEMMKDMSKIISWVEKLEELDTEGVEPLASMTKEVNVWREDVNSDPIDKSAAMDNASKSEDGYFKVPKVID